MLAIREMRVLEADVTLLDPLDDVDEEFLANMVTYGKSVTGIDNVIFISPAHVTELILSSLVWRTSTPELKAPSRASVIWLKFACCV